MNQDSIINQLAHITGSSRKQVIEALKKMSGMSEVRKYLKNGTDDHKGRKKASDGFK